MPEAPLVFGWLADARLAEIVVRHVHIFDELPFILVAAIDSETDLKQLTFKYRGKESEPPLSDRPLVVSGRAFCRMVLDLNMFTGFDEIWVAAAPTVAHPPPDVSLAAPLRLDEGVPSPVSWWVRESRCRLGLGDGFGLNYVGSDRELALALGLI